MFKLCVCGIFAVLGFVLDCTLGFHFQGFVLLLGLIYACMCVYVFFSHVLLFDFV